MSIQKIAVFTSGGDAPGMNAAIRAIVRTGIHYGLEMYGVQRGFDGLIDGNIRKMKRRDVSNILQLGGTVLHSARSPRFYEKEHRRMAHEQLRKFGIDGLVAIGGDGTFAGARQFISEYDLPIVGLPGTIDNDLYGTEFTIGYDTAINTAMNAIDNIKDTANAHDRIFFVEVMGRDAGFIALRSAIAVGAEAVLIPESRTNLDALISLLKSNRKIKKTSNIVVVAEGDEAGGAMKIADLTREKIPDADIRVVILGHIQRGGRPTCMERVRASHMGLAAVRALMEGKKGIMIGLKGQKIQYVPFEKSTKHHEKLNPTLIQLVDILS